MTKPIEFNIPYQSAGEKQFATEVIESGKTSGDGFYTKKCQAFFEEKFGFKKVFLTTSCTDALELSALLLDLKEGDEVIVPSYTFVSTVNPFILRGAKIVFADSLADNPNVDPDQIENLINPKTRAIVVMHYAGMICQMDKIMALANKHNLVVIEDAALALDSYYREKPAGSFGHMSTFSFHVTKNITCGEGGMLVINDERFIKRAEIIREKGTNRNAFFRGEVDKYGWVDIGSSFLPSDILAGVLYGQLMEMDLIQKKRLAIWEQYSAGLKLLSESRKVIISSCPDGHKINASIFYLVCKDLYERTTLIQFMKSKEIVTSFHYQALHKSPFYQSIQKLSLPKAEFYSDTLLRLPLYPDLKQDEVEKIVSAVAEFYDL
jgi:dTDP-4-amino-4,6-dideoxygalactose transaminase